MQEFNAADIRIDMAEVEKKRYYSFGKVRTGRDSVQKGSATELQFKISRDLDGI
ncbi:hypothetical protein N9C84_01005 [Desulfobacterales bacterium]|nr:hypothetical protein [Desulfobacterales bacterium]